MSDQPPTPETPEMPPEGEPASPEAATATRTVVSNRIDFSARLDSFQGPLDLLLYLIKENEVDITNIPIAQILEQYLHFIDQAVEWDLHLAGEFLVMATTLMEVKSRELLPVQEADDGEEIIEDPRTELVRQLLRYRRLKDQARELENRRDVWLHRFSRGSFDEIPEAPVEEPEEQDMVIEFDLYELFSAFERLQRSVLGVAPRSITYDGESVEHRIERIEGILKKKPFARFAELVQDPNSRPDIAITFVALLELVRRRMVRFIQESEFGSIDVKVQSEEEADAVARNEAQAAEEVQTLAEQDRKARERELLEEAEAMGVKVDELPWQKRRQLLAKKKFEGIIKPEDLEEIDAEEAEINRRIDAILAAADAISQRFEDSRAGQHLPGDPGFPAAGGEQAVTTDGDGDAGDDDAPLDAADLAPRPETPPDIHAEAQGLTEKEAEGEASVIDEELAAADVAIERTEADLTEEDLAPQPEAPPPDNVTPGDDGNAPSDETFDPSLN